jgi:hypothetical protein
MPRTIRFHLDENCDRAIAERLRRRGIDVTTTPEEGEGFASGRHERGVLGALDSLDSPSFRSPTEIHPVRRENSARALRSACG